MHPWIQVKTTVFVNTVAIYQASLLRENVFSYEMQEYTQYKQIKIKLNGWHDEHASFHAWLCFS